MTAKAAEYNIAVLGQALEILDWFDVPARRRGYRDAVGPHLRHILEHYEQFLSGLERRVLDYDARARDAEVEESVAAARLRFRSAIEQLRRLGDKNCPAELAVMLCGGLDGGERFQSISSGERELLFLASHAVHHYAIIRDRLLQCGCPLSLDFGKAPATIRHERVAAAAEG
jgi:hypothetical protein